MVSKMKKAIGVFAACVIATSLLAAPCAFANPTVPEIPNALINAKAFSGNTFEGGQDVIFKGAYDRDVYGAGATVTIAESRVNSDALLAGKDIKVADSQLGGSLRAAAQNISLSGAQANGNATVACQSFTSDANSVVAGTVISFCQNAAIAGKAGSVIVYGNDAYIDAVVDGDVSVTAESVAFGPNAKVNGHVEVNAKSEPAVDPNAQIGDMLFTQIVEEDNGADMGALLGVLGGFSILSLIMGILGTAVCAILVELFLRRATAGSAKMVKERTAPMLVSGVVGAIAMPIALVIACCLVLTLPLAGAAFFGMLAITIISGAFTSASLAKLVLPKMHRVLSALIGGCVIGIVCAIPILGGLVSVCCVMYLLGYVIQCIFLGMKSKEEETAAE